MTKTNKIAIIATPILLISLLILFYFFIKPFTPKKYQSNSLQNANANQVNDVMSQAPTESPVQMTVGNKVYELNLTSETTLYDFMLRAQTFSDFTFNGKHYDNLGFLVEEINGITNNKNEKMFWSFSVNGLPAKEGVSTYILKKGDNIEWIYGKI